MINAKLDHCQSLSEFYSEIVRQQEEAHGKHYCAHHNAIRKCLGNSNSYMELGTHQGATAACALLCNPREVHLVDISFEKYNKSKHLFEAYTQENSIKLVTNEISSTNAASTRKTDVLLIDSKHKPNHLWQELNLHASNVNKYIILHDTEIINRKPNTALYQVAEEFCNQINPWYVFKRFRENVGYTILMNSTC